MGYLTSIHSSTQSPCPHYPGHPSCRLPAFASTTPRGQIKPSSRLRYPAPRVSTGQSFTLASFHSSYLVSQTPSSPRFPPTYTQRFFRGGGHQTQRSQRDAAWPRFVRLEEEIDVSHAGANKAIEADGWMDRKEAMDEEKAQTPHRRIILRLARDKFASEHNGPYAVPPEMRRRRGGRSRRRAYLWHVSCNY